MKTAKLIMPYFVQEGRGVRQPFRSMPGVARYSVDRLLSEIDEAKGLGLKKFLLFGVCDRKDNNASAALSSQSLVARAIRAIKERGRAVTIITDVCLCAYTSHGHCGIIRQRGKNFLIDQSKTLAALGAMAVCHAEAGADWVAPSAMAPRQVVFIRRSLDKAGYRKVKILGYSAKFASSFYGPFREAARSAPAFGDRRSYQVAPGDHTRALREIAQDIAEGADMVMVKPALAYLDIIHRAKEKFSCPLAAYNVSGEYALIKLGSQKGIWKEEAAVREVMTAIARAGADEIISYHAKDIAVWEKQKH